MFFLMVLSLNAFATLMNCRAMNKKVTIKECNAFISEKRTKGRAAKLEEIKQKNAEILAIREQKNAEMAAKREQKKAVQMEERKKRDEEREAKRLLEKEERMQKNAEIAAKRKQERLAKLEKSKPPAEEIKPKSETVKPSGSTQSRNDIPPNTTPKSGITSPVEYGDTIGEYRSVIAKSNGVCTGTFEGKCEYWDIYATFQCVDYVKRFYRQYFSKVSEAQEKWIDPNTFWNRPSYANLVKHKVGETSLVPKQGDMLFFDTGNHMGHVAIVTEVSNSKINLIQQNIKRETANASVNYKILNGAIIVDKGMQFPDGSTAQSRMNLLGWLSPND